MAFITRFNLVLVWSKIVQIFPKKSSKWVRHNQVSWSSLISNLHFRWIPNSLRPENNIYQCCHFLHPYSHTVLWSSCNLDTDRPRSKPKASHTSNHFFQYLSTMKVFHFIVLYSRLHITLYFNGVHIVPKSTSLICLKYSWVLSCIACYCYILKRACIPHLI